MCLWATQQSCTEAGQTASSLQDDLTVTNWLLCKPMESPTSPCGPSSCSLAHSEEAMQVQGKLLMGIQQLSTEASPA